MILNATPGRLSPPPFDLFEVKMKYATMEPSEWARARHGETLYEADLWNTIVSIPLPNGKLYQYCINDARGMMPWIRHEKKWEPLDQPENTRFEYEGSILFTPDCPRSIILHDWYMYIHGNTEIIHEHVCGTPREVAHPSGGKTYDDGKHIAFYRPFSKTLHPITSMAVLKKKRSDAFRLWKKKKIHRFNGKQWLRMKGKRRFNVFL